MGNPWMKKNPFMSMWLSTAHRVMGSLRGHASAQAGRQLKAAVTETASAPAPAAAPKTRARRKR